MLSKLIFHHREVNNRFAVFVNPNHFVLQEEMMSKSSVVIVCKSCAARREELDALGIKRRKGVSGDSRLGCIQDGKIASCKDCPESLCCPSDNARVCYGTCEECSSSLNYVKFRKDQRAAIDLRIKALSAA